VTEPIDFNGLDSAVHGPIRLGVLSALAMDGAVDFTTLKQRLGAADGALGIHLRKLEDKGYISCKKSFVGRRPKSTYRMTAQGRKALVEYLEAMQRLIDAVNK
jgi:DNA-binding PadR family transcriptional regulator